MTELGEVLELLEIEQLEPDLYRGYHPQERPMRVFGGHALAQSLKAANLTVAEGRLPHSLHAYFIRAGVSTTPILFRVARLRDGGTFSVRRVSAIQGGEVIFEMVTSSCPPSQPAGDARPMPQVPLPDTLPTLQERLADYVDELDGWWVRQRPFDMRHVGEPPRVAIDGPGAGSTTSQLWTRPLGNVPNDPLTHFCLLAYLSDMSLLEPVMISHRRTTAGPGSISSLDHAMWFHRVPNVDDWLLYDQQELTSSEQRGLAAGYLYQSDGALIGTVTQEAYLSPHNLNLWATAR